ncbi:hypothetical protein AZE42_13037 [Rhizopogon vesiculosus]|uniref:Uncharacterized protein n=1 Tax=Rhizopogon vesiculosus TaxID=180088 RepID=A0A1J8R446_9AGAM|nr:hypothetical protein AZE42_13037 [Rhizopogon vesiculosus]
MLILPQGFFDGAPNNVHFSSTSRHRALLPSSTSRPRYFLGRFPSLFHRPQSTIGESVELQRPQRLSHPDPSVAEVAPVHDKQALFVARQPEQTSDKVKTDQEPHAVDSLYFIPLSPVQIPMIMHRNPTIRLFHLFSRNINLALVYRCPITR